MLGLALCVVVVAAGAAAGSNNLLSDGNFEHPKFSGQFSQGSMLGAWSVTRGNVLLLDSQPATVAPLGAQFLVLTSPTSGGGEICQTVSGLVPGESYSVRIAAASYAPVLPGGSTSFEVTFGGARVARVQLTNTNPAEFKRYDFAAAATGTAEPFCIRGRTTTLTYPLVDAVALKPS
jgi:hypothetical protein